MNHPLKCGTNVGVDILTKDEWGQRYVGVRAMILTSEIEDGLRFYMVELYLPNQETPKRWVEEKDIYPLINYTNAP